MARGSRPSTRKRKVAAIIPDDSAKEILFTQKKPNNLIIESDEETFPSDDEIRLLSDVNQTLDETQKVLDSMSQTPPPSEKNVSNAQSKGKSEYSRKYR